MLERSQVVGRIVAASLRDFTVECFQRDAPPPLGAAVCVVEGGPPLYAVVHSSVTEGVDPSRPLAPHGDADEDLETVLSRHPHLPVLLRTTFAAAIVAHEREGATCFYLPDLPPRLMARVRLCEADELRRLAAHPEFLAPLLQRGEIGDEVAAAFLRHASAVERDAHQFLVGAGRALVPLLINEPERLAALVRQMQPAGEHGR